MEVAYERAHFGWVTLQEIYVGRQLRHSVEKETSVQAPPDGRLLVTGKVETSAVQAAINNINPDLPHYRQIRNFKILPEAFTPDGGLLTAMGKIKRDAIAKRYDAEINSMYERKASA